MKKLTGPKKIATAVFISGRGSNLNNLIKFSKKKKSPIKIDLVISNKKDYQNNRIAEKNILIILKKKKINFICLCGFMRIITNNFIKKFNGKIINIHPSYLPKYKGLNTSARALANNEKFSGCTVHYVTAKLDSGRIIMQKKIKITKNETEKSLDKKVITEEHKLYPKAILKILLNL